MGNPSPAALNYLWVTGKPHPKNINGKQTTLVQLSLCPYSCWKTAFSKRSLDCCGATRKFIIATITPR